MATSTPAQAQQRAPDTRADSNTVVFVCEHRTVKSVIAFSYFNQLAQERGLPYRAISRGTAPDAAIPPFLEDAGGARSHTA